MVWNQKCRWNEIVIWAVWNQLAGGMESESVRFGVKLLVKWSHNLGGMELIVDGMESKSVVWNQASRNQNLGRMKSKSGSMQSGYYGIKIPVVLN